MKVILHRFTFQLIQIALLICTITSCNVNLDSSNSKITIIENFDKISHLSEIISIKEFKHKVIYIDIWGTGCSPCISEFKNLSELKKRYKDENVVFLYLAKPYGLFPISKWKKEMHTYDLEGFHIYMSKELENNIYIEVPGIRQIGIPKYILVNKKGIVAYPDAPRPSSREELYKCIDMLLED